jgi:hypothetical protein
MLEHSTCWLQVTEYIYTLLTYTKEKNIHKVWENEMMPHMQSPDCLLYPYGRRTAQLTLLLCRY